MSKKYLNKDFDEALSARFEHAKENHERFNFQRIQEKLTEDQFDQKIKNQLSSFTPSPPEGTWEKIQPDIPLHLLAKIYLQRLSRVAAIVLIGSIGLTYIYQETDNSLNEAHNKIVKKIAPPIQTTQSTQNNFVFDIRSNDQDNGNKVSDKTTPKIKQKHEEVDDFLALLLEEDDFEKDIDLAVVKKALRPAKMPADQSLTASIEDTYLVDNEKADSKDVILKIDPNLALKVVPETKIDYYLKLYDDLQTER